MEIKNSEMPLRKIGVLTYTREYANIGTNMQSYCTLKAVQRFYPNDRVELVNYSAWKPAMRPYMSQPSLSSLWYDLVRITKYRKFFHEELLFGRKGLVSDNLQSSLSFIRKQKYDAIYVGSDTILELERAHKDELTAYWLDDSLSSKKYLLAASALNVTYNGISERQKAAIQKTIEGFRLLGVRDEATHRLLSNFTKPGDPRLKIIPDPTFVYDIDYSHIERYFEKRKIKFSKPMVCLHLLRDTNWAYELADLFRKRGYLVASLRPAYYADIIFTDLSPFEHVGLYRYFELVITHRFHDSIFCFKNLTPVIVFPERAQDVTAYGESKNATLFKSFDVYKPNYIEDRNSITAAYIISIYEDAIRRFRGKIDVIKKRLVANREEYEEFLRESVNM